ncbi:MAG: galactokinase family protein [Anaerolineae bacterium]
MMNQPPHHTPPPVRAARPEADRIEQLRLQLNHNYGVDPATVRVVKAPLRICPLGAHIDHQLGQVTGMTIDQSILMAFAPAPDSTVCIESLDFEPAVRFSLSDVPAGRPRDWGNYIRGAVLALQRDHRLERGLLGVVDGDMPIGGLSSSAAVTIAYLLALQAINGLELTPEANVSLVRFTENQYIGLNNGILDQSVILFSEENCLTLIDCQTVQIDKVPSPIRGDDFDILVVYSGVTHALVGTDYNNRVAECQEAARRLLASAGAEAGADPRLRQVPPAVFEAEGQGLPETLWRRARHYFGEMERVAEGVDRWRAGDLDRFGALMSQSGNSSINYYECGSPELITLYEILLDTPGVYGARFSGAGFRGNCIALTDPAGRESIAEAIHRRYPAAHPNQAGHYSIHFCRSAACAGLLP